ncbi:MAG: hypothetical protein HYT72_02125 [Candidatus Aenigmarchaeota archaeon]|nr:hypothetical protein [Candidatus Aenigmarchaeota archaeon]
MSEEEEYEIVPLGPVRRLERRLEKVERTGSSLETTRELIEIVRANQSVIDEMVKINSEMMKKVTDLLNNVSELTAKINNFMERIEFSGGEGEPSQELEKKVDERLSKLEKRVNSVLLTSMARTKLRRPLAQAPMA